MAQIINNTHYILSPASQQAVNNACANMGIDTVVIEDDMNPDYPFVSVNDENSNRLFYVSIFTEEIHPFD